MFDKYGEFDSAEEINKAAAELLAKGDTQAVRDISQENGLDPEDAEEFITGEVAELCSPLMAAMGKLKIEAEILKPREIINDWVNYIRKRCSENEDMAIAIRCKGKNIEGCISKLLEWSFKNSYDVDPKITKAAGVSGKVRMGIPGMATAFRIIDEYYLGK